MSEVKIKLYEPALAPEIPSKVVGRATLRMETWEKVGGVGSYADHKPMRTFLLSFREPLFAAGPSSKVPTTMTMQTVLCEAVSIWLKGRNTFQWRAVVPKKEDRDKLAKLKGDWVG